MEKAYQHISLFFVAILGIVIAGFFKTYFGLFPEFQKVTAIQHIHGLLFLCWFIMLIVQPVLIRKKQYKWHRLIGQFSYFLVPLIVISIFFIAREFYETAPATVTYSRRIAGLYVPFYQILSFVTFYGLAIYHRKNSAYHMRYMIVTALAVYGAALKRAFIVWMGVSAPNGFLYTFICTDLILLGLIFYDWKLKKPYKPYLFSLAFLLLIQAGFYEFRDTVIWQTLCGHFVQWAFE